MKTKFTKDLKVIYPHINDPNSFLLIDNDGVCHARIYGANGNSEEMEESEANARLFVAAHALFDACTEALKMYEEIQPTGGYQFLYDSLNSAIKKATE